MRFLSVCSGLGGAELDIVSANLRDLTGVKTERLTVRGFAGRTKDGHSLWLCDCSCGNTKTLPSNSLTRTIPVRSCGCMNRSVAQGRKKQDGSWNEGKSYSIANGEHCYKTRHGWSIAVLRHYGNKCERCGWNKARCDSHHRIAKSKNGLHVISNGIVLCPNCHRIEHERNSNAD